LTNLTFIRFKTNVKRLNFYKSLGDFENKTASGFWGGWNPKDTILFDALTAEKWVQSGMAELLELPEAGEPPILDRISKFLFNLVYAGEHAGI